MPYTSHRMVDAKTRRVLSAVGTELKENPPAIVQQTARKFGRERAAKQRTAILLSKARSRGARIPQRSLHS